MEPYYILKINKFSEAHENYTTSQQLGIESFDDAPAVSFTKSQNLTIGDLHVGKYDLTTEKKTTQRGRACGSHEVFESFIAIKDSTFYCNSCENNLMLHCPKDTFNQFFNAFENNKYFKFSKPIVNFEDIIDNQKSLGIQGIWLGKIDDVNISTLLLLGTNVEDSDKYRQLRAAGAEINNITIVYNFNEVQKKVMITKDGGIILYKSAKETDALLLVNDIYKNLMS
ncbi:MAG: hypothetical protein RSA29_17845 [Clostridium sp.]|uniref:hypothetical protein n=1 Tax=Clostridium sp. TaxID=1506 RepID=UPI00305E869A